MAEHENGHRWSISAKMVSTRSGEIYFYSRRGHIKRFKSNWLRAFDEFDGLIMCERESHECVCLRWMTSGGKDEIRWIEMVIRFYLTPLAFGGGVWRAASAFSTQSFSNFKLNRSRGTRVCVWALTTITFIHFFSCNNTHIYAYTRTRLWRSAISCVNKLIFICYRAHSKCFTNPSDDDSQ